MKYNILIVRNRYDGVININKYTTDWFKQYTPIELEFNVIETDFDVTTYKASNESYSGVICGPDILPKLRTVVPEHKYNCIVFLYGNDLNGIRVSSTNIMGQNPLYDDTELIQTWQGNDNGRTVNHELFHAFFIKAHKLQINVTDNMDSYLHDSDLTVNNKIDTNREIALQTLKPYWDKICSFRNLTQPIMQYKYFKANEIVGLKPELVSLLDKARGIAGIPFIITSGHRTTKENEEVGGVPDSSHLTGEAVDLACSNSHNRFIIVKALYQVGFNRIEVCPLHLHCDISKTLPQEVMPMSQNG